MARKHSPDHQRYQPVDEAFIRSVPFALGTTQPESQDKNPLSNPAVQRSPSVPPPVKILPVQKMEDFDDSFDEQQEVEATPVPERLEKPLKF